MFKICLLVLAVVAAASAKPTLLASPYAYPAALPYAAAPVVATSSQVIARNYNGVVSAPLIAASPYHYPYATYPAAGVIY